MLFSGIDFLYYFLPSFLLVYFLAPKKLKNSVLLIASLIFYGWGEPRLIILMLFSISLNFFLGIRMEEDGGKKAKGWLMVSLVFQLGLLGYYKYANFFMENINAFLGMNIPLLTLSLPLGISFYTFQIISYTLDVYWGKTAASRRIVDLATYIVLFPQLIAGPIVRYVDVEKALSERPHNLKRLWEGFRRFVVGLGKKVLLANVLGELVQGYPVTPQPSILYSWLYAVSFTLQIYFDFSGYSDMAIGLGRMLGFDFLENFNYPYIARTLSEFWQRWHISLSSWFRDYLYIPMGGNRVCRSRWLFNFFVVWFLTGFRHGAAWNFIAWGLYFFVFLVLEKLFLSRFLEKIPGFFSRVYVLFTVMISFILFDSPSLVLALKRGASLFGYGGLPVTTPESVYALRNYGFVLLLSIPAAGGWGKKGAMMLKKKFTPVLFDGIEALFIGGLLLIVSAYLVDSSFNPFLYFRF